MSRIKFLIIAQLLIVTGCFSFTTTPFWTFPSETTTTNTPFPIDECEGGFSGSLYLGNLVNVEYSPEPAFTNKTSILWNSYGDARPSVVLAVCEFTSISGLSFKTENVEYSDIIIDGNYYSGEVNQFGYVGVRRFNDFVSSLKSGSVIKITLTPKNFMLPVEMSNLEIQTCGIYLDCFVDCAVYVLDPATGCKMPRCSSYNPCGEVYCSQEQECRLITGEDRSTFPDVMTMGVQLWGCVDKDRTDYGCTCDGDYGVDEYQCPTCDCGAGQTTTVSPTESVEP